MFGWILYTKEDALKNSRFIKMSINRLARHFIKAELVYTHNMHKELPDFVINRSRDCKIARQLERQGVRVFNNSFVTEIANNKAASYEYLKQKVPYMDICVGNKTPKFSYPYVIKSCAGHGGREVFLVNNEQERKEAETLLKGKEFIYQRLCSDIGRDVRVFVIGNKIIGAMERISKTSFKSNYSLGGSATPYTLNKEEANMVNIILNSLSIDYGGIDFIFHNGKAVFNEIEDAVGARMLYENTEIDSVSLFMDYVVEQMLDNKNMG